MPEQPACHLEPGHQMSIYYVPFADLAERAGCTLLELHNSEIALSEAVQAYSGCDDCSLRGVVCPGGNVFVKEKYRGTLSYDFTRPDGVNSGTTAEKGGVRDKPGRGVMENVLRRRAGDVANCGLQPGSSREVGPREYNDLVSWEGAKEVAGCWDCRLFRNGCEGAVADIKYQTEPTARITGALIGRPFEDGRSPFGKKGVAEISQRDEVNVQVDQGSNGINFAALERVKESLEGMSGWERNKYRRKETMAIQQIYGDQRHESKPHGNKGKRSRGKR